MRKLFIMLLICFCQVYGLWGFGNAVTSSDAEYVDEASIEFHSEYWQANLKFDKSYFFGVFSPISNPVDESLHLFSKRRLHAIDIGR